MSGVNAGRDAAEAAAEAMKNTVSGGVEAVRDGAGGLKEAFLDGASAKDPWYKRWAAKTGTGYGYGEAVVSPVGKLAKGATKGAKRAVGKGLRLAAWTGAIAAGVTALTIFSKRFRNDRHVDNMPPQPQEIEAAPAIPDFSTGTEGQPPGKWQSFIEAQRNGGIPARGLVNPSAAITEGAQDLNAPPTRA